MFVACGIWCIADVSSVSPSSEQFMHNLVCVAGYSWIVTKYHVSPGSKQRDPHSSVTAINSRALQ